MTSPIPRSAFPSSGRRVIFYLLFDPRGQVDDYIPYKLSRLRPFAETIIVISNGPLVDQGREALAGVADEVWERENVGLDVGGYRFALDKFGRSRLAEYDEVILMNYTWFGPVGDFAPMFERMGSQELDYWGMTDHAEFTPHPITLEGTMPSHIQSHWIAVRRSLFTSPEWAEYWDTMPEILTYSDSILHHESRFTSHFEELGFRYRVAFPHEDYPGTAHPAFDRAQQLLDDGCPALKRRVFFHDPLYLDREGVVGRWLLDSVEAQGYPRQLVLQNMSRHAPPKILNTNASMLEILPEREADYDRSAPFRIAATVHIYYEDMTDELLDRLASLPSEYDLYVTTTSQEKADVISARIADRADPGIRRSEVRILPSNRGRDLSGFFIGCRDAVTGGEYDIVVKVHSKKTVQQGSAVGTLFKRQQLENLLGSPGYTANLLGLFQAEPGLGVVFPPTVHIGFPTLGGAWFTNKEPTAALCERLGITVPLDDISPLAPLGAMFIARPEALRLLFQEEISYEDYQPETEHGDGSLAHVQERIVPYAAGELGYHSRTVATAEYAAISHTFLEYKLDQMSSTVQGYAIDEVHTVRERDAIARRITTATRLGFVKFYIGQFHPGLTDRLRPFYRRLRGRPAPGADGQNLGQ